MDGVKTTSDEKDHLISALQQISKDDPAKHLLYSLKGWINMNYLDTAKSGA